MTKRLLDLDDDLLAEVAEILGTVTMKETVVQALLEVRAARLGREHFERLRTMEGLELDDPEVMAGAWR